MEVPINMIDMRIDPGLVTCFFREVVHLRGRRGGVCVIVRTWQRVVRARSASSFAFLCCNQGGKGEEGKKEVSVCESPESKGSWYCF